MESTPSRRSVLRLAAGAALGAPLLATTATLPAAAAQKKGTVVQPGNGLPLVDTHQHLWDLGLFKLPWLADVAKLNRNFVTKDYLEATTGLNLVKTVYMEVDVSPELQDKEAEYVIDLCMRDDNPTAAAVISGRPASAGFRDYIRKYRSSKYIKGVRQVLHGGSTPRGFCHQPEFLRSMQYLGDLGMSYDLCMRGGEVGDAVKVLDACPGTRFILDHCGNPGVQAPAAGWKESISRVAARPNIICKISGIVASANPTRWSAADLAPFVNHCLDEFGPDRVIFGGDWPVCLLAASFRQWVHALREIVATRPEAEQRKLFAENAIRFYGLG
ncbi:MAG: amidohydrolase [Armatimonadetes bacterium]|nr:amidohydrolase [Armatimonadota bacterium]